MNKTIFKPVTYMTEMLVENLIFQIKIESHFGKKPVKTFKNFLKTLVLKW